MPLKPTTDTSIAADDTLTPEAPALTAETGGTGPETPEAPTAPAVDDTAVPPAEAQAGGDHTSEGSTTPEEFIVDPEGNGFPRGALRTVCDYFHIDHTSMSSAEMVVALTQYVHKFDTSVRVRVDEELRQFICLLLDKTPEQMDEMPEDEVAAAVERLKAAASTPATAAPLDDEVMIVPAFVAPWLREVLDAGISGYPTREQKAWAIDQMAVLRARTAAATS